MMIFFETFGIEDSDLADKEKLILEAAIKIFAEKGFDRTTTKEIAREAGVAEGTIFRYFKTKNDLLTGIMAALIRIFTKNVAFKSIEKIIADYDRKSPEVLLKEIIYDRMALVEKILPIVKTAFVQALLNEELREVFYQEIIQRALGLFDQVFAHFKEKKLIRDDVPMDSIFRTIIGSIAIMIIQRNFFPGKIGNIDPDKEIEAVIELIMNGIKPQK